MNTRLARRLLSLLLPVLTVSAISLALPGIARSQTETPTERTPCPPRGAPVGAFISYNANLEFDSEFLSAVNQLTNSYVRQGTTHSARREYDQAERFYTAAINNLNYLYDIVNERAQTNARLGRTAEAIDDYVRAYTLSTNLADIHDRRGLTRVQQANYEGAVSDVTRALELAPYLRINAAYAEAFYEVGNARVEAGLFDAAFVNFNRAVALDPDFAEAFHARGGLHYRLADYDAAISDFTCAISLDPTYAANYHLRGRAFANTGNLEQAVDDLTRAITLEPANALAYLDRGVIHRDQEEYIQAITDFTWAILINPLEGAAYNNRGIAYSELGLFSQAMADFNRAIQLEPRNAAYYNNRAWAMLEAGNNTRAGLDFTRFLLHADYRLGALLVDAYQSLLSASPAAFPPVEPVEIELEPPARG